MTNAPGSDDRRSINDEESQPLSPHHQADRKQSLTMALFCFVLSFDVMANFMTIYFYWGYVSGGAEQYYGLAFAAYYVTTMISAPILAYWGQKRSIREPTIVSLLACILGNASYFAAGSFPEGNELGIFLFILGRLIDGIGGGGITIAMIYLITTSLPDERMQSMNRFRAWQFWGKFAGPALGTLFLYMPSYDVGAVSFNPATYPPLSSIALCLVAVPVVALYCRDIDTPGEGEDVPIWRDREAKRILWDVVKIFPVFVISMMGLWIVFAQIMPIGVILFQIAADNQENIWTIYIPPMLGALLGMIFTKLVIVKSGASDRLVLTVASLGVTLSLLTFVQIQDKEPAWVYFLGTTMLFFSYGILATAFRSIYSQIVGNSRFLNVLMSLLFALAALGQIIGPIFSSAFITVNEAPVDGVPPEQCACDPQVWNYSCCVIEGLNVGSIFAVGCMAICTVYTLIILYYTRLPSLEKKQYYDIDSLE